MNAYELADKLQMDKARALAYVDTVVQSAEMLRQQADRIAELEKQGEPVAWMEYIQDEEWEVWYTKPTDLPEGHSYKPLYLALRIKPLSDEEIVKEWNKFYPDVFHTHLIDFVRAIEERHGIK